ncbi:unnamed protein product [Parnassius apollo]|uniref:(apollo) hypothetical protein n=1 Tax=Parnassius apollo TaxID=110799 RepID=A0A8S3XCF0_PARAO|nr:unnamed protein product [Parnassius apollo]
MGSNDIEDFHDENECPRLVYLSLTLKGEKPSSGEWDFVTVFNNQVLLEEKWQNDLIINDFVLNLNLKEEINQKILADRPLVFFLRTRGKAIKETDPMINSDNRAGGNVDLFPLVLGEKEISVVVPLVVINSGLITDCKVKVFARCRGSSESEKIPLMLTMISAHCLPNVKEGTVFISGISLNNIHSPTAINFGMSQSTSSMSKIVWATASHAGQAANTVFSVPNDDKFVPQHLSLENSDSCNSVYWNAMRRVLVEPTCLQSRLNSTFVFELAGVPKSGKMEVRGRFMSFVDAGVLLQPGQSGVTICAKLLFFSDENLPENSSAILNLPPNSARVSAREKNTFIIDEHGHDAYIVLRFDLIDPLVPKAKKSTLFDHLGFSPRAGIQTTNEDLEFIFPSCESSLDKNCIRKEGGALAVHKELSNLSYKNTLQMNKSIKRTAANRLLMRVRSMIKQFLPEESSVIDYQDTITSQHSAVRRAVTASFAPPPPKSRTSTRSAAARCRIAGDTRISIHHIEKNLQISPNQPRVLLSKVLRCLEERTDSEAYSYLVKALNVNPRNRYLLWIYGGMQFDKEPKETEVAVAALRIAVKGDSSDGTTKAISWAALHSLHHFNNNIYAAFVAAKNMRKSYELPREWRKCLKRWIDSSGEEETFWVPGVIDTQNPLLITAAFFLCLRCFKFSERIIQCVEEGCLQRGTKSNNNRKSQSGIYYLRTASLILQRHLDEALKMAEEGLKMLGPCAILSQIRAICLVFAGGWDGNCEGAFKEADNAGAEPCPALLLRAALGGLQTNLETSLQRAARAHKIAPSASSALIIGKIYFKMGEEQLAERWAAVAVKTEPLLSDGWAFLAILAMYKRDVDKARALLRTARQAGPLSPEIVAELERVKKVVNVEGLPEVIVKDLCLCDYC